MKKNVLSLMMLCCFALMGVAQAQDMVNGINVQTLSGISTMVSNDRDVNDIGVLTYVPDDADSLFIFQLPAGTSWGSMFPASMVSEYAGGSIIAALYLSGNAQMAGTYEVRIYVGGDTEGGTLMSQQSFEITGNETEPITIILDTPVGISGTENIWLMYYQDGSVTAPAIAIRDNVGDPNNRWVYVEPYGWLDLAVAGGAGYCWFSMAYVDDFEMLGENTETVAVYPNPTTSNVTIQAKGMNHISVLNTLGQVVYDANVGSDMQVLDMGQYEAGVYMVRVTTDNGVGVQRVVVK